MGFAPGPHGGDYSAPQPPSCKSRPLCGLLTLLRSGVTPLHYFSYAPGDTIPSDATGPFLHNLPQLTSIEYVPFSRYQGGAWKAPPIRAMCVEIAIRTKG